MKPDTLPNFLRYLLTFLRIAIGWHFLYEGIAKIFTPNWSSVSYLLNSSGPLAGIFRALANNQFLVYLADYTIIFGLILIGAALFIGLSTRLAAMAGAGLLLLFYVSNPPLIVTPIGYGVEGHYLIINKNLIELLMLLVIAFIPGVWFFSVDNIWKKSPEVKPSNVVNVPEEANH